MLSLIDHLPQDTEAKNLEFDRAEFGMIWIANCLFFIAWFDINRITLKYVA